jgi:hypothetical protein
MGRLARLVNRIWPCTDHIYIPFSEVTVPLKTGGHTVFNLLQCVHFRCSHVRGFPTYNANLALREGTDEWVKKLRSWGLSEVEE